MRQPQQKRSADTLERVIQSAERLLREVHAEDLTIAQVVADSGVSVGSIYARFADKDGVFAELVLRFMRTTLATFQSLDIERWQELTLREALTELVQQTTAIYARHRGVIRAISLRARLTRTPHQKAAIDQYNQQVASDMHDLLMMHVESFHHPDPGEAIQTCIDVMSTTLRDRIVLGDGSVDEARVVQRIVDLLLRFLTNPVDHL